MSTLARILEIQRMSTEDGPGIRTTVFFKGCSLACSWCHNPESIGAAAEVVWHSWRCIDCGSCVEVCPQHARTFVPEGARVDRNKCVDCGRCIDECPACAIERQGRRFCLDEVLGEIAKDRAYYEASGGGVTLSGGEPALHPAFAKELLDRCRALGLHTALDTSAMCAWKPLEELAAASDLVLFDIKELDSTRHKAHTGHGNGKILKNLKRLARAMRAGEIEARLWIRTPLIPVATATTENIEEIGTFLSQEVGDLLERWDLCAFNNLCKDKYERLGRSWPFDHTQLLSEDELEDLAAVARGAGLPESVIHIGGPTRVDGRNVDRNVSETDQNDEGSR